MGSKGWWATRPSSRGRSRGEHNPGRVRARGEEWFAIPLDPEECIGVGTEVVVADIERGLLVVYAPNS